MANIKLKEIAVSTNPLKKDVTSSVSEEPKEGNVDISHADGHQSKGLGDISKPYSIIVKKDMSRVESSGLSDETGVSIPIVKKKLAAFLVKEHHESEWPSEILNMSLSDFLDELKDKTSDSNMLDVRKTAEELYDKIELWIEEHLIDSDNDREYWDDYNLDQQEREDFAQDTDFYNREPDEWM